MLVRARVTKKTPPSPSDFHPGVIAVALVEDDDRAAREDEAARFCEIGDTALGDDREGAQHAVMVKPEMELHRRLAERVMRPQKHREREIDERAVERIELVLEAEAVARRHPMTARAELPEQRLVERPGLLFIDARQRRARHWPGAELIEMRRLRGEISNHIAQAVTPGEMCRRQRNEL